MREMGEQRRLREEEQKKLQEEERKPRIEDLHGEIGRTKGDLDEILGKGMWAVDLQGQILHRFSDLELVNLGKSVPETIKILQQRLDDIRAELKQLGDIPK